MRGGGKGGVWGSLAVEGEPGDSPLTCRCEATEAVNRAGHSRHSPLSISTHKILKPAFMGPNARQLMRSFPAAVGVLSGTVLSLLLLEFTCHSAFFSYSPSRFNLVKSAIL